ncbi:unnamed protein product [Linum trigynum]|uniref:MULE transposase domain-containing protein n=1 Tax=Linum trigynum TaxID=586398 RepID=A0AAV2D9Y2_9ROSI
MLLTTVGKYGNNQMYTIAWGVVEGENADSWRWFLNTLSQELGMVDGRSWSVIYDQQKGLVEALRDLLPEAEHRKCARHIYANWKAKTKQILSRIKYRGMRLIDMLEGIRGYLMDRFVLKYKMLYDNPDQLCPRIRKRIEKEKALARLCTSRQTLDDKCEVKMGTRGYIVDLNNRRCICGYRAVCNPCFHGRQAWPEASGYPVLPPKQRAMPGRPKKIGGKQHMSLRFDLKRMEWRSRTLPRSREATQQPASATGKRTRVSHCSKCGSATHNARTCPLNQGAGIQQVRLNVDDRRTIEREMRVATRGIGVYVDETTGNQYVRLNGARGRAVDVGQPTVVDVQGSQPPATQPET